MEIVNVANISESAAAVNRLCSTWKHLGSLRTISKFYGLNPAPRKSVEVRRSDIAAAGEMNTIVTYLNHMQRLESQMAAEITRRYGKDLADRVQAQ